MRRTLSRLWTIEMQFHGLRSRVKYPDRHESTSAATNDCLLAHLTQIVFNNGWWIPDSCTRCDDIKILCCMPCLRRLPIHLHAHLLLCPCQDVSVQFYPSIFFVTHSSLHFPLFIIHPSHLHTLTKDSRASVSIWPNRRHVERNKL